MGSNLLCSALPFAFLIVSLHFFSATSTEFLVGDEDGWAVPDPKQADRYNKWASHNRFNVNDTIRFKYKKDSVMEVREEEYKQCLCSKPVLYGSNGDTMVKLDRAGLFYFISGVSGHCHKGQRIIIKVLEPLSPPHPPTVAPPHNNNNNNNSAVSISSSFFGIFFMFFVSFLFI